MFSIPPRTRAELAVPPNIPDKELFGSCPSSSEEIEVCSGEVLAKPNLVTVDINPAKKPSYIIDGQELPKEWNNCFGRWNCDPPYFI
jgi:hypothetical protein